MLTEQAYYANYVMHIMSVYNAKDEYPSSENAADIPACAFYGAHSLFSGHSAGSHTHESSADRFEDTYIHSYTGIYTDLHAAGLPQTAWADRCTVARLVHAYSGVPRVPASML